MRDIKNSTKNSKYKYEKNSKKIDSNIIIRVCIIIY